MTDEAPAAAPWDPVMGEQMQEAMPASGDASGEPPQALWDDAEETPPASEVPGLGLATAEAPRGESPAEEKDAPPIEAGTSADAPPIEASGMAEVVTPPGDVMGLTPDTKPQEEALFTSAVPPSTQDPSQESPVPGQDKDNQPKTPEEVTIDIDGVSPVPPLEEGNRTDRASKKSEGRRPPSDRRGSLGSYKAETLLYDRLGVEATATDLEIRNAYKRMALQLHPDKGGDPEKFTQMKEAYEVLSNHQKRTIYDLHGMEGIKRMEQAAQMEGHMDMAPLLLILMQLAQTNLLMRGILVAIILLLGSVLVLPFILLTLKWDGDSSFSWAVAFIPFWIFQLLLLCCQMVFLSAHQPPPPDEEDPEAGMTYSKSKKELRLLWFQSAAMHVLLLTFQILLILRLDGVLTGSWFGVISPWLALEVWWLLLRVYVSPVAWAVSDPQAATQAATQATRPPAYWIFLLGYLQVGFFRFLTSILLAARASAEGENLVSWGLVFMPLYISMALYVAIPCLQLVAKRRRQSLLSQEEDRPGPVAAKGCLALFWLIMIAVAAGKFDGGSYSAGWVFFPIFFLVSLAVCVLSLVIMLAQPRHFEHAAESMGEPIGKPTQTE